MIRSLLAKGAKVDVRNERGNTALMLAAASGRKEAVQLLLDHNADADIRNLKREQAHTLAEAAGHHDIVQLLESHPANKKGFLGLF